MLKITAYAERLLEDLDKLEWPDKVKKNAGRLDWKNLMVQKLTLKLEGHDETIRVLYNTPQIRYMVRHLWCLHQNMVLLKN